MTSTNITTDCTKDHELFLGHSLVERCLGNIQLAQRLLEKFETVSQDDIQQLRASLEAGDFPSIQRGAHRLKGSAASIGSPLLAAVASEIETKSLDSDSKDIADLISKLTRHREQFLAVASFH